MARLANTGAVFVGCRSFGKVSESILLLTTEVELLTGNALQQQLCGCVAKYSLIHKPGGKSLIRCSIHYKPVVPSFFAGHEICELSTSYDIASKECSLWTHLLHFLHCFLVLFFRLIIVVMIVLRWGNVKHLRFSFGGFRKHLRQSNF